MKRRINYGTDPHEPTAPLQEEGLFIEKELHLRDYLMVLRKRKTAAYTTFLIIAVLVLIYNFSITPQYEATAKLLIEQGQANPLLSNYATGVRDPEFLSTQAQIIKSMPVGLKVVDMLNLEATYNSYFAGQDDGFSLLGLRRAMVGWVKNAVATSLQVIGLSRADTLSDLDSDADALAKAEAIANEISENINVRPSKDSRIVTISYLSPNPILGASIVNSVSKAYIDKTFEMKMESSSYTLKWMTEKANEAEQKLEALEHALQQYMEDNDIITIENRITITPQQLIEINNQLMQVQARSKELELIYSRLKQLPRDLKGAESIQAIADDMAMQSLRNQTLRAEQRVMDLSKTYGPKHPMMKQATADLEVLKHQRRMEIQRVIESIRNEYDLVRDREREYQKLLLETKQDASHLNEKMIRYNNLKREIETNKQLQDTLLAKIKEQNLAEQAQSVKVWVVEKAKMPKMPAKPNKKRNFALGLMLALAIGIALAFFIDYMDNTLKNPDDVEERFDLPVIGSIAKLDVSKGLPEKEVIDNPSSHFSENIKTIRTSILFSSADAQTKRFMVTSMSQAEGKTTLTINLAISMAQAEKHVLLIDADMRKPQIHKVFNLNNNNGLSNYLAGASDEISIHQGVYENLDIITSGITHPNPSEMLLSKRLGKLVEKMNNNYDIILFDCPPVLTVSDSLAINKIVERIILIARSGKTPYNVFERGLRTIDNVGGRIIGIILNAIDMNKSNYYYYSRYYKSDYVEDEKTAS